MGVPNRTFPDPEDERRRRNLGVNRMQNAAFSQGRGEKVSI
jgi:hypothetical protein